MYTNLASITKKNRADQIITSIGSNGLMNFYSGSIPLSPDLTPSGTLLASLPLSTIAGVSSLAFYNSVITNPGTGGNDGTYNLVITGGGGNGAAGTFSVVGGILKTISISNNGYGYTSSVTLGGFGGASLSGASAISIMTGIMVFNTITSATGLATGVASFVRVSTSSGTGIIDLDVGTTNSYSVVMDNTFINLGSAVTCSADILIES